MQPNPKSKIFWSLIFICALYFLIPQPTQGSFGITPPYIRNETLAKNSEFKQTIIIVRGDPDEDLQAEINFDVPGAQNWFSIDRGNTFILPKGENKIPIVVSVRVPESAEFRRYKGRATIKVASLKPPQKGTVGIALGAQMDVDITVVDKKIFDFNVVRIALADLEEGRKWFGLFFPGKIKFTVWIQNLGNIPAAPTKVVFDIFDLKGETLLERTENTNRLRKIKPFEEGEIEVELPTRLPHGNYTAKFRVFKDDEIKKEGELNLGILPVGSIPGYKGYGFIGLSARDKTIVIGFAVFLAALLAFLLKLIFGRLRQRKSNK